MGKITYADKVALNDNPNIADINKVKDTDMNEIKNVVNQNETKLLLAVSNTAPAQCSEGDMYFNTSSNLIYTATGTNTWGSTGVAPTLNTIYVVLSTNLIYAYNGTTLISIGGKQPENTYSTSQDNSYSCAFLNGTVLFESQSTGGESGDVLLTDSAANYRKIEIEYTDWDQDVYEGITTIYNPNGKLINIHVSRYNTQNNQAYLASTRYSISGTTMQIVSLYTGLYRLGGSPSSGNYVRIRRVIGYK